MSFLMEVKSYIIKDIIFAEMFESFVAVVLIECAFFVFSPLMCLLVRSQGFSMFLLELRIN